MAPETLIFHTPCIWWHLQKREPCNNKSSVHSPSRQAGKVGHREPQNTQLQTHRLVFFFPPQILNFSFDYSLPVLQRGFKDFDVPKMRIRPGSKPQFMSCCWSPASADQLPPRLWPRLPPPHMAQSLRMGLLTAVLISTSIPEYSKRQAGLGGY